MKTDKIKELIVEYLNGDMDPGQEAEFFEILEINGYSPDDLKRLEGLYGSMEDITVPEPGRNMHNRFYSMLEDQKEILDKKESLFDSIVNRIRPLFENRMLPRLAYGAVLLIIGFTSGLLFKGDSGYDKQITGMSTEIREIREMMILNLIDHPSASERIKVVNSTNNLNSINEKVINALLRTLNSDPNDNVRLVTVEALYEFSDNPKVREGLVQAIGNQESPLVQLALADIMVRLQEKTAVTHFTKLLQNKDLNHAVRERLQKCVKVLL